MKDNGFVEDIKVKLALEETNLTHTPTQTDLHGNREIKQNVRERVYRAKCREVGREKAFVGS